jgi:hypothetical protein
MTDILAPLRDSEGLIPNDKLDEAIAIIEEQNQKMIVDLGGITPTDQLYLIETTTTSALGFLAAQFADLSNEVTEMWNFVGKMSGVKAHRNKKTDNDIDNIQKAFRFSKLMAVYKLLKQKGATDSGLIVPGRKE